MEIGKLILAQFCNKAQGEQWQKAAAVAGMLSSTSYRDRITQLQGLVQTEIVVSLGFP